ncbi:MAG: hypothetical protein ACOYJF_00975 [Prevotella sp.]|jgi:hypothetical protein
MTRILLYNALGNHLSEAYEEFVSMLADQLRLHYEVTVASSMHDVPLKELSSFSIVHILGCWKSSAASLLLKADERNVLSVFSPLGGLQPWRIKRHSGIFSVSRKRQMTQRASAVHLCGKLERKTFEQLGWNRRTATIKNPVFTGEITPGEMAAQMMALYRKVVDSNARRVLSAEARTILGALLQVGVDDFVLRDKKHCDEVKKEAQQLTGEDWRMICIYAFDEMVGDELRLGLNRLHLEPPLVDVGSLDRFTSKSRYPEGPLKSDALMSHNILMKGKLHDYVSEDEVNELKLCVQMANLRYEAERHRAPLRHLLDIYCTLRFCDTDEVRVVEILKMVNLDNFAARLMAVLQKVLGLTEGFMPLNPKDDSHAGRLLRILTKLPE